MYRSLKSRGTPSALLWGLLFVMAGCEKNSDLAANNSYLCVSNISYNTLPIDVTLKGFLLTANGKLGFGQTGGLPGNPYYTGVAGTSNLRAAPGDSLSYVNGTISMLANCYYSLFIFDSLQGGQLKTLVTQDILNPPGNGFSGIRLLNFSYDTLGIMLVNGTDTITAGNVPFAGTIQGPNGLANFFSIPAAGYEIIAQRNAQVVLDDSLYLDNGKLYTVFTQGNANAPAPYSLALGQIRHN